MNTWNTSDIKSHFREMIRRCADEPQMVYEKNKPIAVILNFRTFKKLSALPRRQKRPTMRQLLNELHDIRQTEDVEMDIPSRRDRSNAMESLLHELSV